MEFEGRAQLAISSSEFFEQNRDIFIKFCTDISKNEASLDLYKVEQCVGDIYDSLFIKEPDFEALKESINETFKAKTNFANYLISSSFLHLLSSFIKKGNDKQHLHLVNAIERMLQFLNIEKKPQQQAPLNTNFSSSIFKIGEDREREESIILEDLHKIHKENKELSFLNLYKDVPIKHKAKIISIEGNNVVFSVDALQILAILEEKNAFILQDHGLLSHLKADLIKFDLVGLTIKLGNFSRMEYMPASKRATPRVHPNITTPVTLTNAEGKSTRGVMYDISNGGLGVLATESLECKNGDKIKAEFDLKLDNWEEKKSITQELDIVVLLNNKGTYRFCMQNPQEPSETIKDFTKQREFETIQDLKECVSNYI